MGDNKMIYTTYLSKLKDIPDNAIKVCISRYAPNNTLEKYNCRRIDCLAPTGWLLDRYKTDKDFDRFKKSYLREISVMTIEENNTVKELLDLCVNNDVYLICYEKDYELCHRSIVAELISNKLEIPWEEAKL